MALIFQNETLDIPYWRIELWEAKGDRYVTDLSKLVATSIRVQKERNKADELEFTLDLKQFELRAASLGTAPETMLRPYIHKIKVYRENEFVTECIVEKIEVNLNNEAKNTLEVSCIGWFGLFAKRLIHQDYANGSWAEFAQQVVMDAQHEPNRIYNYSFEGDAHKVTNSWFRGWDFNFPGQANWQPDTRYFPGDIVIYQGSRYYAKRRNSTWDSIEVGMQTSCDTLVKINKDPVTDVVAKSWKIKTKVTSDTELSFERKNIKDVTTRNVYLGWTTTDDTYFGLSYMPTRGKLRAKHNWALYFVDPDGRSSVLKRNGLDIFYYDANGRYTYSVRNAYVQGNGQIKLPANLEIVDMEGDIAVDSQVSFIVRNGNNWKVRFSDGTIIQRNGKEIKVNNTILSNSAGNVLQTKYKMTNVGATVVEIIGTPNKDPDINVRIDKSNDWRINFSDGSSLVRSGLAITLYDNDPNLGLQTIQLSNSAGAVLEGKEEWRLPQMATITNITGQPAADGDIKLVTDDHVSGKGFESSYWQEKTELCWRSEEAYAGTSSCWVNEGGCEISTTLVSPFSPELGRLYFRCFVNKISADSKMYLIAERDNRQEFWRSNNLLDDKTFDSWQKVELLLPQLTSDIYRLALLFEDNGAQIDCVVAYKEQIEGDVWDLGIRNGDFPNGNDISSWNTNRFSSTYQWKQADNTLYDLSMMESDNFEYDIDEKLRFNIHSTKGRNVVEVDLSYPKNITQMTATANAADVYNYIVGDAADDVFHDPEVSHVNTVNSAPFMHIGYDEESQQKYWALAEKNRYDSERDIASLKSDIEANLSVFANVQDIPSVSVDNSAIDIEKVALGDLVSITALGIPYVQSINGLYRIIGYAISISTDGTESLDLVLAMPTVKQINAMSFARMVRILQERAVRAR